TWYSLEEPSEAPNHAAVVVHFEGDFLGTPFFDCPELVEVSDLLRRAAVGLEFATRLESAEVQLVRRLPKLRSLERLLALLEVLRRLAQLEANALSTAEYVPVLRHERRRQIDRVCGFINEHYTEELQQSQVAAMLDMSAARFSQFFRRSTGRTFVQYVNALRVAHACRLLIETDLSVTEIGLQSGFFNVSNFNRRFKEVKEMSPRAYRKCYHQVGS
ncbi:MAG: helix-turn-helix transcriptional regulator, partial [Bythopirellula sp.]